MCNYLRPYIPRLSVASQCTLRELNRKNVEFTWNLTCMRKHLNKCKTPCGKCSNMVQYFDQMKPIVLECDASGNGISGTLLQDGQPIVFVCQALPETQKRYFNIERGLLAMVVVMEKLHHYVFGRCFNVHTDHSPSGKPFPKVSEWYFPRATIIYC